MRYNNSQILLVTTQETIQVLIRVVELVIIRVVEHLQVVELVLVVQGHRVQDHQVQGHRVQVGVVLRLILHW